MRVISLLTGLCLIGLATAPVPALRAGPTQQPVASAPARVTLNGVTYVDAGAFLGRYGLKPHWITANRRQSFASNWSKVEVEIDQREITLNGLRVFMGEAAILRGRTLFIPQIDAERLLGPILRPSTLAVKRPLKTIVIDAGHGGNDTGTQNTTLRLDEKNLTLDVARRLASLLGGNDWRIIMTRTDDRRIELADRAAKATAAGADLFISIHFNSVTGANGVKGSETYVLTPRYQRSTSSDRRSASDSEDQPGNAHDAWSAVLGYQIHRQLLDKLRTEDRGLKRARFAVLRLATCPAVLVEAGYLSNLDEAKKITGERYRTDIAEAIANGVKAYAAAQASARR